MYLAPPRVAANLSAFAALSAAGSRLAPAYLSKDGARFPHSLFVSPLGEPVRTHPGTRLGERGLPWLERILTAQKILLTSSGFERISL
jgi:hypothetical protein